MKKATVYVTNEIIVSVNYGTVRVLDSNTLMFLDADKNIVASFCSYLGFVQEEKTVVKLSDIVDCVEGFNKIKSGSF